VATFNIAAARKAGASDAEIAEFLAGKANFDIDAARKAGADDTQIAAHLAKNPTVPAKRLAPTRAEMLLALRIPETRAEAPTATEMRELATGKVVPAPKATFGGNLAATGREVARQTLPTAAAVLSAEAGAGVGATTGAALGLLAGPAAPIVSPALALLGGLGGGLYGGYQGYKGASQLQQYGLDQLSQDTKDRLGLSQAKREQDIATYPWSTRIAAAAPSVMSGRPGALQEMLTGAALGAGTTAAQQYVGGGARGDNKFDLGDIVIGAAQGAATSRPWGLGTVLGPQDTVLQAEVRRQRPTTRGGRAAAADEMLTQRRGLETAGLPQPLPLEVMPRRVVENVVPRATAANPETERLFKQYSDDALSGTSPVGASSLAKPLIEGSVADTRTPAEVAQAAQAQVEATTPAPSYEPGVPGQRAQAKAVAEREAKETAVSEKYTSAKKVGDAFFAERPQPLSPMQAATDEPYMATSGPATVDDLIKTVGDSASDFRSEVDPTLTSRTDAALARMRGWKSGDVTVARLFDADRAFSGIIRDNPGSTDAAAAMAAKKALREQIMALDDANRFVGDEKAVRAWREAIKERRELGEIYESGGLLEKFTAPGAREGTKLDPDYASKAIFGSGEGFRQGPTTSRDLHIAQDYFGEGSPEWNDLRAEGAQRAIGSDPTKAAERLAAFEKNTPKDLVDLLITPADRRAVAGMAAASRTQTETVAGLKSGASFFEPSEAFAQKFSGSSTELQSAKVAMRQKMREAFVTPQQGIKFLQDVSDSADAQANMRLLLGDGPTDTFLTSAKALLERSKRAQAVGAQGSKGAPEIGPEIVVEGVKGLLNTKALGLLAPLTSFLGARGMNAAEAARFAKDALDPAKTEEVVKFIKTTYGDNAAMAFAKRVRATAAKVSQYAVPGAISMGVAESRQPEKEKEEYTPPELSPSVEDITDEELTALRSGGSDVENLSDEEVGYTPTSYTQGEGPSLGERNNNQGNIINGPFAEKQPGYDGVGEGGFAKFKTTKAGNDAQERLLATTYLSKGFNTPNKIVEKYSPREDPRNTPEVMAEYKKKIADKLGIGIDDPIPLNMVVPLAQAMRAVETGNTSGVYVSVEDPDTGKLIPADKYVAQRRVSGG
jgi:hypothetical protein